MIFSDINFYWWTYFYFSNCNTFIVNFSFLVVILKNLFSYVTILCLGLDLFYVGFIHSFIIHSFINSREFFSQLQILIVGISVSFHSTGHNYKYLFHIFHFFILMFLILENFSDLPSSINLFNFVWVEPLSLFEILFFSIFF